MPTMVLRFPGGRYHATPGGHHVNEGVVEWPPSPWRLVRALIACGYSTQHWGEVPPEGQRLVEALSSVLPEYRLPQAALGHSRHYMPTTKMKDGREETTLVLDAFADVGDGALWVRWPAKVDEEAQQIFDVLVAHLGYLGRSESWVLGESISDDVPLPQAGRAFPHSNDARPGRNFEQIALSAPDIPVEYATWRKSEVEAAIKELSLPAGKKPTQAQQRKIQGAYPADLVDCLQRDTAWWKEKKWSRAPGCRSALYWREGNALEVGPPSSPRVSDAHRVEMMLLALTTPSGSKSALPTVARTLPQAELLHSALVSKLGFGGEPCAEIVGRDEMGEPLKGHKHSHILPVDLDGDGRLDHIVLFAPMGLGARAQRAVRSLRRTYMKGGVGELQVAVAGVGALNDMRAIGAGMVQAVNDLLGPTTGAVSWVSTTPFVPPRHLKKSGRSSLVGQVEAELQVRGLPPAKVDVLDWTGETLALRHFVRRRLRGPQPLIDVCFAVRLAFDSPVGGPICLGYGSHFGLGLFRPVQEPNQP
ncbi:MAG: type I-U CRISPR-associated protein Cas5/Cas6 [Gammaproteobacteria bacterium]|nr:type I-U CRISPR-associated protein Cas5/Cas6 [Gammaproteobacteria bacterium]